MTDHRQPVAPTLPTWDEQAYGASVYVRVLGPVEVSRDGSDVRLGGPKQRAALALLTAEVGKVVSTDALIDGLWGDEPTPGARSTLQTYVSNLRHELGDVIVREGGGYRLDVEPERVDAVEFEQEVAEAQELAETNPAEASQQIRSALALWRGHPYANVAGSFRLELEASRLEELRLRALETRIDAELALGHHAELVPELDVLCTEFPLREGFRAQHMLALYRSGRQAEALRAFQKTRTYLAEELGLDPSELLRALERKILNQDPSLLLETEPQVQTLAFLLTDIEDSTVLWEMQTAAMRSAVAEHDRIVFEAVERAGGKIVKRVGDGIDTAFADVGAAVRAAEQIQRGLVTVDWGETGPLAVRMAIDVGAVEARSGDYFGPVLNRAGRMLAAGHGGQVLLSADAHLALAATESGWQAKALGEFRFKGIGSPQNVFQLLLDGLPADFAPLRIDRLPPRLPAPAFGRALRGYELRENVGSGDFGIVYRAYQPSVGREVAIKVIRPELVNQPSFVRRFEAEAQLIAQLEHPHIVTLYDYWRDPDGAYLVMRWLRGGSLRQALERGPWNAAPAARLLMEVGGALAYAHRQGVVHGDFKPANVLLDDEGHAYLSDFGIAIRTGAPTEPPRVVTSSPAYVPPEELEGAPKTPRSDLYCLGLLTFELLTGRRPPMDGALPSLSEIRPELPESLDGVIVTATAPEPGDRYESVEAFLAAVGHALGAGAPPAEDTYTPAESPYKGLRAFGEADADDFFGRDSLVAELVAALGEHRLVAVVGPSGIGKSSVVKAGLVPALRDGALAESRSWVFSDMFPGSYPYEELAAALLRVAVERPDDLVDQLARDELGMTRVTKRILPPESELLLVVDQFEELFTLTVLEEDRRRFLDGLIQLAVDSRSRVRVVITLRADFLDQPLRFPEFGELVKAGMVAVTAPSADDLAGAIEGPARRVGVRFEPGLVSRIVADIEDQPGALPLLQYALTELFGARRSDVLTLDGYQATGGVIGALGRRAEELFARLDPSEQAAARQVFLRLVSVDPQAQDTRRRIRRQELRRLELEPAALEEILDLYGDHRLLTFDREPLTRSPTVEVAHEALLSQWERLRVWVDERREDLLLQRRLVEAANEWEQSGRSPDYLPPEGRLGQLETWAGATDLALTAGEREFLAEARSAADEAARRQARRRRAILAGFASLSVVASVLAVFGFIQRGNARGSAERAVAERLGAQALLKDDLDRSLLLARESVNQYDSVTTRGNLLAALVRRPAAIGLLHGDGDRQQRVAASPDGRLVATGDNDGTLTFFDLTTLKRSGAPLELATKEFAGPIWAMAFSPDGRTLAVAAQGLTRLVLVDVAGRTVRLVEQFPTDVPVRKFSHYGLEYSPDGKTLIASETILDKEFTPVRSEIVFRDARTGDRLGRTIDAGTIGAQGPDPFLSLAFTPDGRQIVGGGEQSAAVWSTTTGRLLRTFAPANSVAVSPTGAQLALGQIDGSVVFVDTRTGRKRPASGRHADRVIDLAFAPDGKTLLTGGADGDVIVWDVASGTVREVLSGHSRNVQRPAITPDGRTVVTVAHDATIVVWDIEGRRRLGRPFTFGPPGEERQAPIHDVGRDGRTLVIARERKIDLWDAQALRRRDSITTAAPVIWVALSPDGSRLAVTVQGKAPVHGYLTGGTVVLYDVATRRPVASRRVPLAWALDFDPSGDLIAVGQEDGRVSFLDAHTLAPVGTPIRQPAKPYADGVYFHGDLRWSNDGQLLVLPYVQADKVTVWDAAARRVEATITVQAPAQAAFSPDGRLLVIGDNDGTPSFWDTRTWRRVAKPVQGHSSPITTLSFSPDGRTLATAGPGDEQVILWDVASYRQIGSALPRNGPTLAVTYHPDGRRVIALSSTGRGTVWGVDPESWKRRACRIANRNLTRAEWRDFVGDRAYSPTCL